jgi:hypothetical protein
MTNKKCMQIHPCCSSPTDSNLLMVGTNSTVRCRNENNSKWLLNLLATLPQKFKIHIQDIPYIRYYWKSFSKKIRNPEGGALSGVAQIKGPTVYLFTNQGGGGSLKFSKNSKCLWVIELKFVWRLIIFKWFFWRQCNKSSSPFVSSFNVWSF